MTVAFMALLSLLLGERVIARHRHAWLATLVSLGIAAALYWYWTETGGQGDLRPYVLVQFLPVVLMPLILLMFPRRYLDTALLLQSFCLYFIAKALEHYDERVLDITGLLGGHALKHLAAAAAVLCIILAVPALGRARSRAVACTDHPAG